jgi:hypothetical protein
VREAKILEHAIGLDEHACAARERDVACHVRT